MTALKDKCLSEIVAEHNSTAEIFEKYNIDYCNSADLTPLDAINGANITELLTDLELAISNEPLSNINFNELSVTETSEIIRNEYHDFLRQKISEISTMSRQINAKYKDEITEKIHELVLAMFNHLAPHMVNEEKVIFPYLEYMEHTVLKGKVPKPASFGKLKKSVSTMLDDHSSSVGQLDELKSLTNDYTYAEDSDAEFKLFYDELHSLDRNLRMHIFIENHILFKKARAMEEAIFNS